MNEEVRFPLNDTTRSIEQTIENLKKFDSPLCDARIKAIVLTNLEQAALWSLKLIKNDNRM